MSLGGLNTSRGYLKSCLGTITVPGGSHIMPGFRKSKPVMFQMMPGMQFRLIQGVRGVKSVVRRVQCH